MARSAQQLWREFLQAHKIPVSLRPEITEAWQRCFDAGLDQTRVVVQAVDPVDLERRRQRRSGLIKLALPVMEPLRKVLCAHPHVVGLLDEDAVNLIILTDEKTREIGPSINIVEGACWSEKKMGVCGPGTAVATGKPVVIIGREHYLDALIDWTCMGAPIRHPNGQIIGLVSLAIPNQFAHHHSFGMLLTAAEAVEARMREFHQNPLIQNGIDLQDQAIEFAHEIRNPLTAVKGVIQLLNSNQLDEKFSPYLDMALKELDRATELLSFFMALHKPINPAFQAVDLNEIIGCLGALMSPVVADRGVEFRMVLSNGPLIVRADPKLIHQVGQNLIRNALEAMDSGGKLTVRTVLTGSMASAAFSDNGPGIPPERLSTIFHPYVTGNEKGVGVGLALCEKIIRVHGGRISVKSDLGLGTVFEIKIPRDK